MEKVLKEVFGGKFVTVLTCTDITQVVSGIFIDEDSDFIILGAPISVTDYGKEEKTEGTFSLFSFKKEHILSIRFEEKNPLKTRKKK